MTSASDAEVNSEKPRKSLVATTEAFPDMCHDFSLLLKPPSEDVKSQVESIEKTVQATLSRLDDFSALVESTKSTTQSASAELVPKLVARAQDVQQLFARIDQLQVFLDLLDESVSQMEKRADQVEKEYGGTKLTKLFSSLMSKVTNDKRPPLQWEPVNTIKTEDFFS